MHLLVLVGTFLAVAAFLLPETMAVRENLRDDRTIRILDRLEGALRRFGEDTGEVPAQLQDLSTPACVPVGWCGPYLGDAFGTAPPGFATSLGADAFGTTISWSASTETLGTLRSAGPDRTLGTADDLVRTVDVVSARRAETLHRIVAANGAIRRYLVALHGPMDPWLPTAWPAAISILRTRDALDADPIWDADAWGTPFVEDPAPLSSYGAPPGTLRKVTSSNL